MSRCQHCSGPIWTDADNQQTCAWCGREPAAPPQPPARPPRDPWHGTLGGYTNQGCRCRRCSEAHALYWKSYRRDHAEVLRANDKRKTERRRAQKEAAG